MKKIRLLRRIFFLFLLIAYNSNAQKMFTIKGSFPEAKNANVELIGFDAFKQMPLGTAQCDAAGNFVLLYAESYSGAALLKIKEGSSLLVMLNKENFSINWQNLQDFKTLSFKNSPENEAFSKGMELYQQSEMVLSGLKYLKPLYEKEPKELQWIDNEIKKKTTAFQVFTAGLSADSYTKYYLDIRKFIEDIPVTANRYIERMPEHEKKFATMDFADPRLLHSGMLNGVLDNFYQLMESYGDLSKVTEHANKATDALLNSLSKNPALKKEIADYVFKLLEKRSQFDAAEHLAMAMLNDNACTLDDKSVARYEQYRKMGIGKNAPPLVLSDENGKKREFSAINARYKLIVFGASWCPACQTEIPELKKQYQDWKSLYDLEVVYVSLDTEKDKHANFIKDLPWISSCDYKGWESQNIVDYCVFATPTLYLLDKENKIVLKPFSAGHLNSWLMSNGVK